MAAQTGTFVDDARLRPRDSSADGGRVNSEFGDKGSTVRSAPQAGTMRSGGGQGRMEKTTKVSGKGGY
jgi:hypothetical protein